MTSDKTSAPLSITVLGGTGFTGSALVRVATERGHRVTAISRTHPTTPVQGATHVAASALDDATLQLAVQGADVVVSALSPRGELLDHLAAVDARVAELASAAGVRLGVIGGFSCLRTAPGAPRMAEGDDLPPEFAVEARQMLDVLVALESTPETVDWFVAAPSMGYGAHAPTATTGTWRTGDDVASFDPERAALSDNDFAAAVLAELEHPTRHRTVLSVTG